MDKGSIEVLGLNMAYVEEGAGPPIVLLHGNPTSSFLWRSVIPIVCPVTWDDWPDAARDILQAFRSPAGKEMILGRKLFANAEPGPILTGRQRELCRSWPNQVEVTIPGIHFVQEDSGDQIGAAIASGLAS